VQVKDQPQNCDPNDKIDEIIPELETQNASEDKQKSGDIFLHEEELIKPEQDRASLQSEQSYPNERVSLSQNIQASEQENANDDDPKILLHDEPQTCSASSNTQ
jgi:hypothetical protein